MSHQLLTAIAEWQMEATRENNTQLFFPISELPLLIDGRRLFVIGRKGAGKTAIAEHIMGSQGFDTFTEKLSFQDFPFHILYALKDSSYPHQSQYISLWKFVILGCLSKLMIANQSISAEARETLRRKFPLDGQSKLNRVLSSWMTRAFGVNILGSGLNFSESRSLVPTSQWWDELDALESLTREHIDGSKYYILFDALDDDYREMQSAEKVSQYLDLLVSLFKAAVDIYETFKKSDAHVIPIIFLRSDIYELLMDNDKNKWSDLEFNLNWRMDSLQQMLAHRITRTENPDQTSRPFVTAWRSAFSGERIDIGDRIIEKFDYISFRTNSRPRDYIFYIKQCAKVASQKGRDIIDASTVINSERSYSEYLKKEIVDEMSPLLPEINMVLRALTKLNKGVFNAEEFYDIFDEMLKNMEKSQDKLLFTPPQILDLLYRFDVIGNRTGSGHRVFRHTGSDNTIDFDRPLVVHVGLLRGLQIGNPRKATPVRY